MCERKRITQNGQMNLRNPSEKRFVKDVEQENEKEKVLIKLVNYNTHT